MGVRNNDPRPKNRGVVVRSGDTLIVNGYDVVYEAFATREHHFMETPHLYIPRQLIGYDGLIFGAYGERWKNIRKFTMTVLRDFGVGHATLKERIMAELEAVTAAANVICSINFGDRFEYSNEKFQRLLNVTDELFSMRLITAVDNVMPILRFIPNGFLPKALAIFTEIRRFTQEVIDEHRSTFDPENIRDFVDYYLLAAHESAHKDSDVTIAKGVELDSFSDSHLFQILANLFNGGTETTATSLGWLFLYLLKYPDVQRKEQQEIDTYTHAMIVEMQRHANIAAIGPPHAPLRDTFWHRYNIPRKSMIIANLWSVHRDPKYWHNADAYDPDRWLDKDGKFVKREAFLPFLI
ncbi:PREDICTED: cytochrome P450 2J3-like [Priapulus caudatus]|uniref:Cytochrome P450 2J3-like n=1 Tax=Priapulus caudatus TaxID=37621 RepID=A0ABM1E4U9_PRICU|nr:PREDICTED: cytochrome P450 2J3-like [Priapulus caudatus]